MNALSALRPRTLPVAILAVLLLLPSHVRAQDSMSEQRTLTLDDYPEWSRITSVGLSADGRWMTYAYSPNEGDATLYVRDLDGTTVHEIARGSGPEFSDDSNWVVYYVSSEEEDGDGGGSRSLEILDLRTGETSSDGAVGGFTFSEGSRYLAVRRAAGDRDAEHDGTDLIVHDLDTGSILNIGNVSEYAFNDDGSMLSYVVDAANRTGNGVYLVELDRAQTFPLNTGAFDYSGLDWADSGDALAVLRGSDVEGMVHTHNALVGFIHLGGGADNGREMFVYDPSEDPDFPDGFVLSDLRGPDWIADGSRVVLGIKEQREEVEEGDDDRPDVDVWHWADEQVQSVQQVRANQNRRFTYAAVYNLHDRSFLRLADDDMRQVNMTRNGRWGIGRLDTPYRGEVTWGGSRADYYRVDLDSGERTLLVEGLGRNMGTSPDSRWMLYLQNGEVFAREMESGRTENLSAKAGVNFVDITDDHPYELPAYGVAGWAADGSSVILEHRFDLWSVDLEGDEAVNLTAGVGDRDQIQFRLDSSNIEDGEIDLSRPLLLSGYGEWTKKSGYFEGRAGQAPTPLVWEDRMIGSLQIADDADRVIFTRQTFEEFPDYWVADTRFANPRKITDANPQLSEFAWGRRVLIDYVDARGNTLQATLALPANYEEGRRYPMIVYFYEKMSQRHHQFSMPVYDDRPHMSTYASNGYLVLMPDIVYEIGRPGSSALDDVGSAVEKTIELGYADPDAIGLQGHSWGGYQSSFILTQTDLFSAVVTGAPPTNLISFYNTLYKSTGTIQQGITEVGQVRMGTTPFEDPELYRSQSPIHNAENISTPFIILHGTADGAVDWMQGLEYYNMARRLGKEVIFLSYPDEPHHLAQEANQKDFQVRMKQFFDHHLTGAPAPDWMVEGVPFLEKGRAKPTDGIGGGSGMR